MRETRLFHPGPYCVESHVRRREQECARYEHRVRKAAHDRIMEGQAEALIRSVFTHLGKP